jgi:23S rRNA U2552 (ribose-2'-O)-methylase RlmE/FtsJ
MDSALKPPWINVQWQKRILDPVPQLTFGPWCDKQPEELQTAKNRISALEQTHKWELVKKMVNPYEMVYTHDDPHFHPSIAVIKPLSRSYFKLIEILDVLQFFEGLPKQAPKIRTAHIAEGPGGFIQAITDLSERYKKTVQQATAMTLRPTNQRVPGWRRASSFLHHHREVRLHYGADNTGDVYVKENQDSFVENVTCGANIFTADGGFDFSVNYDIQEKCVFKLLVCSAMTGLRCLQPDGSFILKIFDIFSESTMVLIDLMGRCFKEWVLYKPAISRPCNSERYFLGRGFIGVTLKAFEEIESHTAVEEYPSGVDSAYIRSHVLSQMEQQCKAILLAEKYALHPEVWYDTQLHNDFKTSLAWCQRFRIPFIWTKPMAVHPVVYTSEPVVFQQLLTPGDDLETLLPSYPALPTSSAEYLGRNQDQSQSQKDGDNHERIREVES